ncbi:MAG: RNA polymerase-associated protein rapA [Gammaproteobacteria bacterium]|nr:RNA polymerase-associated protein rapA [Gammaproteobacteria bacterium]
MKKQNLILSSALVALFSTSVTFAETEVTGKFIHESAQFTRSGTSIGDTSEHGKDLFKSETSVKVFFDGDVGKESTFHVEVQGVANGKAIDDYASVESYTQRDPLREAYIDTEVGDWSIRTGKQQVVWGTADGIKLLDMINPTDYSEMAQNQMEDSRIPVWMINAEKDLDNGGNFQVIVSQAKENIFAGLNRNVNTAVRSNDTSNLLTTGAIKDVVSPGHNKGQAFTLKGVDTITGEKNGFLNVAPDLGSIATNFAFAFGNNGIANGTGRGTSNPFGGLSAPQLAGFTVAGFSGATLKQSYEGATANGLTAEAANFRANVGYQLAKQGGLSDTEAFAQAGATFDAQAGQIKGGQFLDMSAGNYGSNLANYSTSKADSAFEYMNRTSFATFNSFINAKSQYVYDMPDDTDTNLAFRFKNSTNGGLNYSANYSYNYDANPVIDLSWRNDKGEKLEVVTRPGFDAQGTHTAVVGVNSKADGTGEAYGGATGKDATLRFTQTLKRAHNIGGSFDAAIETNALGAIVIRGEALYQKDVYSPVFNRGKLAIGDLVGALKMTKGDRFKYVLGVDITVLKNMLISTQFIQDRNLDYVDNNTDFDGSSCVGKGANCGTYTGDFASMHMNNNFNKAEKNKEFYSLFFSKPFGASGEHRWNNIFMFEENGGKWNRLDAEFSINDDVQATIEYNKYWGNENTQFGQLKDTSNVQVGIKYTF